MSNEDSFVKCSECGGNAFKVYSPDEVKKKYPDNPIMQLNMLKEYKCVDCGNTWSLSRAEIIKAYANKMSNEGLSNYEIVKDIKNKKKEIEKMYKEKKKKFMQGKGGI